MSIIWSLKRILDPNGHRREEAERDTERDNHHQAHAGDPPRFQVDTPSPPEVPPAQFRCRVCGYESRAGDYCPDCLADTMVVVVPASPQPEPNDND